MKMDRETELDAEYQSLRVLCHQSISLEEGWDLIQSLSHHIFVEPEHQVVFESIRALLPRGPISAARLRVHLNNRGFPDTDVEKYFQPAPAGRAQKQPTDKIVP